LYNADKNNDNTMPIFIGLNKTQVILKQLPNSKFLKIDNSKDHKRILCIVENMDTAIGEWHRKG
jgi:hypothetical protein